MHTLEWTLHRVQMDLRFTWKIARGAATTSKTNLVVKVSDGTHEGLGEISTNSRYGESHERAQSEFDAFIRDFPISIPSEADHDRLIAYLIDQRVSHSVSLGIETAYVHYLCRYFNMEVHDYLGVDLPQPMATCFSIPIADLADIPELLAPLDRFPYIKIKVDTAHGVETIQEIARHTSRPLRIDGNEDWQDVDSFMRFVEAIRGKNIELMEQPFPAAMKDAYRSIKGKIPFPIFADESIEDHADFSSLREQFDGLNVKMMKAGSYKNAIELLREARRQNMKTMIGCMVETSLGISTGFMLSSLADYIDLDGFLFLKQDPFGLMHEEKGILSLARRPI